MWLEFWTICFSSPFFLYDNIVFKDLMTNQSHVSSLTQYDVIQFLYTKLWSHLLIVFLWKTFSHYFCFLLFLVCLSPTMSSNITPLFACHTQCKRNLRENTPQKETTEAYTNTNLGSLTDTLMFDILHLRGWKIAPCTWRGYYSVETYGPRAPGSTPMCARNDPNIATKTCKHSCLTTYGTCGTVSIFTQ